MLAGNSTRTAILAGLVLSGMSAPAHAREGLDLAATYTADVSVAASGGVDGKARYLDNLNLSLDADLDKLIGLDGATFHVNVLNNLGARPNDAAGTLEGVNNIEVGRAALRLYQAWGEQAFGPATLRVGLYDINTEFNVTDSAGLLLAPPFGISSEFASSGPAGAPTFPSSALAARLRTEFGENKAYAQVVVLNARAQTLGDIGGVDLTFDDGLLVAGEVGAGEKVRVSLGAWTFTRAFDALSATDVNGLPLQERPAGIYAMTEAKLADGGQRAVTAFVRGGIARGRTQGFANSLQAGILATPAIIGRDDSTVALGFHHSKTSDDFRQAQAAAGDPIWHNETALELTYADRLMPHLTLQPDVQVIRMTGAGMAARTTVMTTLRMTIDF